MPILFIQPESKTTLLNAGYSSSNICLTIYYCCLSVLYLPSGGWMIDPGLSPECLPVETRPGQNPRSWRAPGPSARPGARLWGTRTGLPPNCPMGARGPAVESAPPRKGTAVRKAAGSQWIPQPFTGITPASPLRDPRPCVSTPQPAICHPTSEAGFPHSAQHTAASHPCTCVNAPFQQGRSSGRTGNSVPC